MRRSFGPGWLRFNVICTVVVFLYMYWLILPIISSKDFDIFSSSYPIVVVGYRQPSLRSAGICSDNVKATHHILSGVLFYYRQTIALQPSNHKKWNLNCWWRMIHQMCSKSHCIVGKSTLSLSLSESCSMSLSVLLISMFPFPNRFCSLNTFTFSMSVQAC